MKENKNAKGHKKENKKVGNQNFESLQNDQIEIFKKKGEAKKDERNENEKSICAVDIIISYHLLIFD